MQSDVLAKGRAQAGLVEWIEAGTDQVWLTDGLVRDRIAAQAEEIAQIVR